MIIDIKRKVDDLNTSLYRAKKGVNNSSTDITNINTNKKAHNSSINIDIADINK